jgi:hypothetical protein
LAAIVGVAILGMAGISAIVDSWYDSMLGGRPLPQLTDLVLRLHGTPELLLAGVIFFISSHALIVHALVSRQSDPVRALWTWNMCAIFTALLLVIYVVCCVLFLMLPGMSIISGMLKTPETLAREQRQWWIFLGSTVGAVVYGVLIAVVMWRSGKSGKD